MTLRGLGLSLAALLILCGTTPALAQTSSADLGGPPAAPGEQSILQAGEPADGAEVPSGEVALRVTPYGSDGGELDVEFRGGSVRDVEPEAIEAMAGTTPDTTLVDRSDLVTTTGLDEISSDTEFPFQLFTVDVPADAGSEFTAQVHWSGSANPEAKVLMYVLGADGQAWRQVDQHLTTGGAPTDFTLTAMVPADGHLADGRLTVLVQHSEGFTTTGQTSRDDEVPPYSENGVTPRSSYDFTVGVLSDTQFYNMAPEFHHYQLDINQFLVDHRDDLNLQYVLHSGDIVDDWRESEQWERADAAYQILDDAGVPYGVIAGNHDVAADEVDQSIVDYTEYAAWFGDARFAQQPWFGGSHLDNRGHYDLISAGGIDFLMLSVGWGIGDEQIDWMNEVISRYPERAVWINLHEFLLTTGGLTVESQRVLDEVVAAHSNVFAVSSGHHHGALTRSFTFDDDGDGVEERTVHAMLFNYQWLPDGETGYLRLLHFDNERRRIIVRTYSPTHDDFDADHPYLDGMAQDFEVAYPASVVPRTRTLEHTSFEVELFVPVFRQTREAVPSGTQAHVTWAVDPGDHAWFARTRDDEGRVHHSEVRRFVALHPFTDTPEPTILGHPQVGEVLRVEPGQWGPVDPAITLTHRWLADGKPIPGAVDASLRLEPAHSGARIRVEVTGHQVGYADAVVLSGPSLPVDPAVAGAEPRVTGKAQVGRVLKVAPGAWATGARLTYQWAADGVSIPGATRSFLTLAPVHRGKRITVTATGSLGVQQLVRSSAPTAKVAQGELKGPKPRITGRARVGKRLVARPGRWTSGTRVKYRWFANGKRIKGASGKRLRLRAALLGTRVRVRIVANQPGYAKKTKQSPRTRPVRR